MAVRPYAIPSEAEMYDLFPPKGTKAPKPTSSVSSPSSSSSSSGASKKAPKAKPPCKYGPRGEDGYCPKKPPSSARTVKANSASKGLNYKAAGTELASQALAYAVTDWEGVKAGSKAVLSGADLKTAAQAGIGAGIGVVGTAAAAAAVAGAAAYFGTTWVMDQIAKKKYANSKQGKQQAAAAAYREARKDLALKLGREITFEENKVLGAKFKEALASIGA